jgi:hypothetical protein
MEGTSSYDISTMNGSTFASKIQRPPNVGTSADIPDDLLRLAHLQKDKVVAWVTIDDEFNETIGRFTCCSAFGVFLVMPCFWPHLLILWPCLLAGKLSADRIINNTYWVLTTTEIKIIVKSHKGCCGTNGDKVKSIPLDTITDCGISAQDTACGKCYTGIPTIYIDTASSGGDKSGHEAIGYGLSGYDWLVTEIFARRDALKGHNHQLSLPPPINAGMDRGENTKEVESVKSRLEKLKDLHSLGMLSDIEYEKKRQDIIASI